MLLITLTTRLLRWYTVPDRDLQHLERFNYFDPHDFFPIDLKYENINT